MESVDFTVAVAVLIVDGKVLINQRPKGWLKGYWEFPGGKLEEGELVEVALKRELLEEFNLVIEPVRELMVYDFNYDKYISRLRFWLCNASAVAIEVLLPLEGQNFVWAELGDVVEGKYEFLAGNKLFVEKILQFTEA